MRLAPTGRLALACLLLATAVATRIYGSRTANEILVSAAASLTESMNEIGEAYTRANPGVTVRFNFGASGSLQRQIEQGAPVDVFASASPAEMDALQTKGLLAPGTRADFARNRIVLIVPSGSKLKGWADLHGPSVRHIAISDPASVPSGRYARDTLTHRGLWNAVQAKTVYGENVRQTLAYVAHGDADAGIVFATDARVESGRVRVVAAADPAHDHRPIVYPAAVLRDAPNAPAARRFCTFLRSDAARAILKRHGFTVQ